MLREVLWMDGTLLIILLPHQRNKLIFMEITTNKKEINKGIIVGVFVFSLISILSFDIIFPKIGIDNKRNLIFYSTIFSIPLTQWIGNWVFKKIKVDTFKPILFGLIIYSIFFFLVFLFYFIYYSKG
jgi:hypothetical protein